MHSRRCHIGLLTFCLGIGACAAQKRSEAVPPPEAKKGQLVAAPTAPEDPEYRERLERQLGAGWGWRSDKDDQVHAPLLDWRHWKRVRFWGVRHLTGFRYGKGHHVLTIAVPVQLPAGTERSSSSCMIAFEQWARPQARQYDVVLGPMRTKRGNWRDERLLIKWVDGHVDFGFKRRRFSAAWAAFPAYQGACLVYAVSVQWKSEPELAQRVRDRFVEEGFEQMDTLTDLLPSRH